MGAPYVEPARADGSRGKKKLWIITKDSDYGTIYNGEGFLNQFLYEELRKVSPDAQAFLFDNVVDGIKAFAGVTGVKADKLPTPEQIEEIKKEEENLPPLDWMVSSTDDVAMRARVAQMTEQRAALFGGTGGLSFSRDTSRSR
jgi:hypothetical protein